MKIGDLVVRSYAWHSLVPGIIVDEEVEVVTANNEEYAYEQCEFVVQWSDGVQTKELYEELDYYENVLMYEHGYNREEEATVETSKE